MNELKRKVSKDNEKRDLEIVKNYNAGWSIVDLVVEYRRSPARIYQILKKYEATQTKHE